MRSKVTVAAVLLSALFALPALAQPAAPTGRPSPGQPDAVRAPQPSVRGGGQPRASAPARRAQPARPTVGAVGGTADRGGGAKLRARVLRQRIGLAEERAAKVERAMDRYVPDKLKAKDEIRQARRSLRELLRAGSDDQKAYSVALDRLQRGHQALETARVRELNAIRKELSPKEQALLLGMVDNLRRQANARKARPAAPVRRPPVR